jgi:hypothetical protein
MFANRVIEKIKYSFIQGCTNSRLQVALPTKFCKVAPNICGSSVWNLLHVMLLALKILRQLLGFFEKFVHPWFYV